MGRRLTTERTPFGRWINEASYGKPHPEDPPDLLEKVVDPETLGRILSIKNDPQLSRIINTTPQLKLLVKDNNGDIVYTLGDHYTRQQPMLLHISRFEELFPEYVQAAKTSKAIRDSASLVNGVLQQLSKIRPKQHIYWTWPNAARECFLDIPVPVRMRAGAKKFTITEDLEQELSKLKMIYSALEEKGGVT